jgi:hypothetical protein
VQLVPRQRSLPGVREPRLTERVNELPGRSAERREGKQDLVQVEWVGGQDRASTAKVVLESKKIKTIDDRCE